MLVCGLCEFRFWPFESRAHEIGGRCLLVALESGWQ